MTVKDLQKLIDQDTINQEQDNPDLNILKSKLYSTGSRGGTWKKFYIWPETTHQLRYKNSHGRCCFYHLLGAAQKDGIDMPLLPWQKLFWQMLHERRRIWCKKSRGIGFSTLMLYIIAYKCLTEFQPGDRVIIITGIRLETVADLLRRFRLLFQKNFPEIYIELSKQKDTECIINGVIITGLPARADSCRGFDRVKLCWVDEADHWVHPTESKAIRSAVEGFYLNPTARICSWCFRLLQRGQWGCLKP